MNARIKLNTVAIWAAIIIGAVIGTLFSSWVVFVLVTGGIIAFGFYTKEIRLGPTSRRGKRRR